MRKYRLAIIIALCTIVYIMSYFQRVAPAILSTDLLAAFAIPPSQLGVFSGASMLAYGVMQLPSGMMADLFGGRRVLAALSIVTGLGTLWFSLAHSLESAFFARFLTGAGLAVTVPIITVLVEWCPPRQFVRISSLILSTAGLGGILAAPPLHLLSGRFGWRASMIGFGMISLALALALRMGIPAGSRSASPRATLTLPTLLQAMKTVFLSRIFRTLGVWYMMLCGASYCMSTLWWGPYLMQGRGLDGLTVSTVLSGISLGVMAAFLVLGFLAGTVGKNFQKILVVCTLLVCFCLAALVFCPARLPVGVITMAAAVFAGCSSAIGPMTYSLMKDHYPPSLSGTAVGIVNMTFPVWASLLQYVYGSILAFCQQHIPTCAPHNMALGFILINCAIAFLFLLRYFTGSDEKASQP